MTLLGEILAHKRAEVAAAKAQAPAEEMARRARARAAGDPARGFRRALAAARAPRIIAELKRRSPSRGEIRAGFDAAALARSLERGGAAALSVLTDSRYFGGGLEVLGAARSACALPLLRKDFVIDGYQVDEARAHGADAVLLIAAALPGAALRRLRERAAELEMDALVEVHSEAELEAAQRAGADLLGINNRDLRSFETDLSVCERLAPLAPPGALLVAESGIFGAGDVRRLSRAGAAAFLVGEALMRAPDPGQALSALRKSGERGS